MKKNVLIKITAVIFSTLLISCVPVKQKPAPQVPIPKARPAEETVEIEEEAVDQPNWKEVPALKDIYTKYFDYFGLIDTAFKIYMQQMTFDAKFNFEFDENSGKIIRENRCSCLFYYGEPVSVKQGKGFLVNIFVDNNEYFAKIKLKKGFCIVRVRDEPNMKETIKDLDSGDIESVEEVENKKSCGCKSK